ncbi:MAG: 16S rRNA (cytosine(967)-C(5))-methyltransferase RsmB [Ignavibacteria bacterium]
MNNNQKKENSIIDNDDSFITPHGDDSFATEQREITSDSNILINIENKKPLYENNVRALAVKIITRCERSDAYLDKILDFEIRNSNLNDFDKSLLTEITHGVIRWMRRLDWFLNGFYRGQYEKCVPEIKNALRVALYQILFLNKIPYFAAVNEAVEFVKQIRGEKHAGVVNGVLRNIIRTLDALVWPTREIDEVNYLGIVQSHPNWMVRRWVNRFGFEETAALCEANNKRPLIYLRLNKMKGTIAQLTEYLTEKNFAFNISPYLDYFFGIKMMSKIYEDEQFKSGMFTVQDVSAGLVTHLVDPKEGELVMDLCAAPGGKTTHMAEYSNDLAKIIAIDKYFLRLESLKKNVERLGLKNILLLQEDLTNPKTDLVRSKMIGKADKVLVDAPCSGFGVITKKPDIKWKRDSKDIIKLTKVQFELLELAEKFVKPGGALIYSTCTTEIEENQEMIERFLNKYPYYTIDSATKYLPLEVVNSSGVMETFPHHHNIDGAFAVRLLKLV